MEQAVVSGIAFNRDEAKISVLGVPDKPGIAYQILGAVADANIEVDVIIQNVMDGKTDFSFPKLLNDYARTIDLLKDKVVPALGAQEVAGDAKICKVSIVASCAATWALPARCSVACPKKASTIQMISTPRRSRPQSLSIDEKYMELALCRQLHRVFRLDQPAA